MVLGLREKRWLFRVVENAYRSILTHLFPQLRRRHAAHRMNPTYQVNDRRTSRITVDEDAMRAFEVLSGDTNPIHVDDESARRFGFSRRVAYAGILLAEISRIIGTLIPGPGALCVSYQFDFRAPVYVGESVVFEATLTHYSAAARVVLLRFVAHREHDSVTALRGEATVRVPREAGQPQPASAGS